MKKRNILWGLLLIALGLIFGLNALDLTHIDIFFDGWWTLFIIIPCAIGLFENKDKTANLIGLVIGLVLLLVCWDILDLGLILKLFFPAVLVFTGLSILLKGMHTDQQAQQYIETNPLDSTAQEYCATFSGLDLHFQGQHFDGAKLTAVFGGIDLDLTGAVMDQDIVIEATAIFGSIDITVPQNYRVRICSNSIFGGVSDDGNHPNEEGLITVFVNGKCMFGGVNIR